MKETIKQKMRHAYRGLRRCVWYPTVRRSLPQWRQFAIDHTHNRVRTICRHLVQVESDEAIDTLDNSWKLPDRAFPYSCTDEEGLVMAYLIEECGLKSGFEIATAFGFSSLYIGLGLNKNHGRLVTMDCYIEEQEESFSYKTLELQEFVSHVKAQARSGSMPRGLIMARDNAIELGLRDTIKFEIGVSPQDVPSVLKDLLIDFAFIDGAHYGEQPLRDFKAIYPYLEAKCLVCFHDNNGNLDVLAGVRMAEDMLQANAITLPTRYRLTVVSRGLALEPVNVVYNLLAYRHATWRY